MEDEFETRAARFMERFELQWAAERALEREKSCQHKPLSERRRRRWLARHLQDLARGWPVSKAVRRLRNRDWVAAAVAAERDARNSCGMHGTL